MVHSYLIPKDHISVYQAHSLLGLSQPLTPGATLEKTDIQEAYRKAAFLYHPDSAAGAGDATKFRQCHQARHVLMRHYNCYSGQAGPSIYTNTTSTNTTTSTSSSWRQKSYSPIAFLQHSRARKFTIGLKAFVLFAAACDGVYERNRHNTAQTWHDQNHSV